MYYNIKKKIYATFRLNVLDKCPLWSAISMGERVNKKAKPYLALDLKRRNVL